MSRLPVPRKGTESPSATGQRGFAWSRNGNAEFCQTGPAQARAFRVALTPLFRFHRMPRPEPRVDSLPYPAESTEFHGETSNVRSTIALADN